jgi:hypothetical protein
LTNGLDVFHCCCVGTRSVKSLGEAVKITARELLLGSEVPLEEQPEFVKWLCAFVRVFDQIEDLCLGLFGKLFFQLEVEINFAVYYSQLCSSNLLDEYLLLMPSMTASRRFMCIYMIVSGVERLGRVAHTSMVAFLSFSSGSKAMAPLR